MCSLLLRAYIRGIVSLAIICALYGSSVKCFVLKSKHVIGTSSSSDPNEPLILTPFIEQNKTEEARKAARVNFTEFNDTESYSGYFTVDKRYHSNTFFWFFPAEEDYENAPVVLWLQGGPGASSLYGLFTENGPFSISADGSVIRRESTWSKKHSMIYIDNPVGTGFSFTDEDGYAKNETIIGKHLYQALLQFFQVFPELQKNDFYITGESYAGKYVPALGYTIYKNNPLAKQLINLQGLAIGNGWTDPLHQTGYAKYLYEIGLIDLNLKRKIAKMEKVLVKLIRQKRWEKATNMSDTITNTVMNSTGFNNYYNYLEAKSRNDVVYAAFLQRKEVKQAIHVGDRNFGDLSNKVADMLINDEMKSVAGLVAKLLSQYRILLYTGQLDIIVAYPLTLNYLQHLNFSGADQYKTAERHQWMVKDDIAGYVKQAGNLTEVLVRNAGHMVPTDQPLWALDLITKFTHNQPIFSSVPNRT